MPRAPKKIEPSPSTTATFRSVSRERDGTSRLVQSCTRDKEIRNKVSSSALRNINRDYVLPRPPAWRVASAEPSVRRRVPKAAAKEWEPADETAHVKKPLGAAVGGVALDLRLARPDLALLNHRERYLNAQRIGEEPYSGDDRAVATHFPAYTVSATEPRSVPAADSYFLPGK